MALVAQFASAWDGASRAQFVPAWIEDAVPLVLVTAIDAGNVSQSLTTIDNPSSSEPVITLAHRADAGAWRHLHFALDDAEGKRPLFKADRTTRYTNADPTAEYRPVWTQDFLTWTRAPSRQLVGGSSGTIEWQFSDPFPAGRVYVATQPLGRQIDATYFAQELLSAHSAVCSPAATADAFGVFSTSPSETDGTGRQVGGHPMYALRFSFGGETTDGGPKRKLVMTAGLHAAGEATSWLAFVGCVRWILDSPSAEAVALRANWDVAIYFNLTPNGVYGGSNRRNFRSGVDPNRIWDAPNAEVGATQTAILAEIGGGRFDAFYSWHAWSGASSPFLCYVTPSQVSTSTRRPVMQAMISAAASIFGATASITSSGTENTDVFWAEQHGCQAVFNTEVPQNGSTDPLMFQTIGESWAKTLQAVDAAGYFAPVTHELSGAAVSISTAAGTLITSIQLAGSAASLSTAGGNLTAQITLSGAALAQAAATAALTAGAADLAGDAHATAEAIGTLTTQIRLSGAAVSQALAGADLTTESAGLSGSAQASATAMGLLGTGIPLVGEATATASAAGSLGVTILLSGAAAAVSSATGELTIALALEGHSLASALASGSLTTQIRLSGAALGRAAASGALAGTQIETPARRIYRVRYPPES